MVEYSCVGYIIIMGSTVGAFHSEEENEMCRLQPMVPLTGMVNSWVDNICDRIGEKGALRAKHLFLPLFKLSPHQGLQRPWLPASFTDTSGLLLHRSNIKSYSISSVSSGELTK